MKRQKVISSRKSNRGRGKSPIGKLGGDFNLLIEGYEERKLIASGCVALEGFICQ